RPRKSPAGLLFQLQPAAGRDKKKWQTRARGGAKPLATLRVLRDWGYGTNAPLEKRRVFPSLVVTAISTPSAGRLMTFPPIKDLLQFRAPLAALKEKSRFSARTNSLSSFGFNRMSRMALLP